MSRARKFFAAPSRNRSAKNFSTVGNFSAAESFSDARDLTARNFGARVFSYARIFAARIFAFALAIAIFTVGAPARAATAVAIVPAEGGERIEHELIDAVRALPDTALVNAAANGKLTASRAALREPDPTARAQAVGREAKAARALTADVQPLGDGAVVYLRAVDVASGADLGSATFTLAGAALTPEERAHLRGAVTRALVPARYVGRLELHVDVPTAEAVVDGNPVRADSPIELAVGEHALRVTHPAYRDFLRFLEINYGETQKISVALSMFPVDEGQMTVHRSAALPPMNDTPRKKRNWRWWVIGAAVAVAAGAAVGIVYAARPSVSADRVVDFHPTTPP